MDPIIGSLISIGLTAVFQQMRIAGMTAAQIDEKLKEELAKFNENNPDKIPEV